jgi:cytochrome c biogenesis protein
VTENTETETGRNAEADAAAEERELVAAGRMTTTAAEDHADADGFTGSAAGQPPAPGTVGIGLVGWLRWFWRQLTSMRVALILLFLLSLAAIPGSLIPQHSDQLKVDAFKQAHPTLTPLYERLGMFHVYSSPWFSAIYILLFVSLAGCIVPRTWQFVGQLRSRPPAAPRNLTRLPAYSTWRTDATPEQVTAAAERALRGRRFRTSTSGTSVAGEKGYLREAGNLLFHVALFGLLIAFAATSLEAAQGGKLIVEGDGFTNNPTQYDDFSGGTLYGKSDLQPFGFSLDSFDATYATSGPERGSGRTFRANIHYWNGAEGKQVKGSISVNHPLSIGGEKVYLISHGYAPVVTVKDGKGDIAYEGPVPFLPQDQVYTSRGVVKVPDVSGGQPQIGLVGFLLPTAVQMGTGQWVSTNPEPTSPLLVLSVWSGNLGLDTGVPQNVYQLDETGLTQAKDAAGAPVTLDLRPGDTVTLPNGLGTLTFDGMRRFAAFDLRKDPALGWLLVLALTALAGLTASLFVPRRRLWVRAAPSTLDRDQGPTTVVTAAGLARGDDVGLAPELGRVLEAVLGGPVIVTGRAPAEDDVGGD